ncbi:hypothetical protein ES703_45537 [subsurface metagenome]
MGEILKDPLLDAVLDAFKISVSHMTGVTITGDMTDWAKVFNSVLTDFARPLGVNEYAQCAFGSLVSLRDWRIRGHANNTNENGLFSLRYLNEFGTWANIKTGIPGRMVNTWTAWENFSSVVEATAIRITCTTYDVDSDCIAELQVRGIKGE